MPEATLPAITDFFSGLVEKRHFAAAGSLLPCLIAIAAIVERGPIGSLCAADVVPMHRMRRVGAGGAPRLRPAQAGGWLQRGTTPSSRRGGGGGVGGGWRGDGRAHG